MDVYLIRHTAVAVAGGTCYGQTDVPLQANCGEAFKSISQKISLQASPLVYSSPASRCQQLARHFSSAVEIDARLWELHFGEWEYCLWKDIPEEPLREWMENYVAQAPPGGESYQQLYERAANFWQEKVVPARAEQILIIAHAGLIRSLLAHLLEISLPNTFKLQIDYGSITHVQLRDGYAQIGYINR